MILLRTWNLIRYKIYKIEDEKKGEYVGFIGGKKTSLPPNLTKIWEETSEIMQIIGTTNGIIEKKVKKQDNFELFVQVFVTNIMNNKSLSYTIEKGGKN